jgi:arabinose-5-phosphate isomerase
MKSKIIDYAKSVLKEESDAIVALSDRLDDNFEHATKLILSLLSHGHLITSGMGKGGIIAQKVSATFASIGVPSFFLHPAEAVHGDIGRFTKLDIALVFSNSGETEEILRMIPAIKRIGCPIISVTATSESSLAKHSDINITLGKTTEAGPLAMAPTTSTTAMLALGDALAMTVLAQKGLTKEEYAFYHPGGSLGRALLTVDEIMRVGDELCLVEPQMLCVDVLKKITSTKNRPGAALVVDQSNKLVGIFTDGDLRRLLSKSVDFLKQPVQEVMGTNPKTILKGKLLSEAARVLTEHSIDQLAVIDKTGQAIGLIDIQDVAKV